MPTHRLRRFLNLLAGLRRCTVPDLIPIVRERRHSVLLRVAALRWLIHLAPLEVTQGRCYLARRRLVRQHYGV